MVKTIAVVVAALLILAWLFYRMGSRGQRNKTKAADYKRQLEIQERTDAIRRHNASLSDDERTKRMLERSQRYD